MDKEICEFQLKGAPFKQYSRMEITYTNDKFEAKVLATENDEVVEDIVFDNPIDFDHYLADKMQVALLEDKE